MVRSTFLTFIRTYTKNKAAFIINLIGLSIAIGCAIVAFVNYEFNHNFDSTQKNAQFLYRISAIHEFNNEEKKYGLIPVPLASLLRENNSEIAAVVRYLPGDGQFKIDDDLFEREIIYTDPEFSSIFNIEMTSGVFDLLDKSKIYISE